jgi:Cu/Ag efflux pump CusA
MHAFFSGVLRFRLLILALAVGVMSFGLVQLRHAPVDVFGEFTPPYAEIQTEALGLSAEEVEQLITVPLEADLLNGVEGVEIIRSESVPGLSSIVLVFAPGTNIYKARQLVEERLTQAHALPNVSTPPTLLQPLSSSNRVLMIGLSSDELNLIQQSVIARWTIRPHLMGVPGVANVSVWGMRDQQLQVQVDPARLRDRGVTLNQVVTTAGNAQVVSPLSFLEASTPGTGGFIETPQQRLQVRHLIEKIANPAELAKVPVDDTKGRLKLSDVATVVVDHQPLIGDAVVNGKSGLFLVVEKFPGISAAQVTEDVEGALETLRPGLSGMSTDTTVYRPADYVADARQNVLGGALIGGILMLLAFAAFGFRWRSAIIAAVTVPLSLISAALVQTLMGQSVNVLLLAGLAAAVAIVVDEAVAPTEQVLRQFRAGPDATGTLAGDSPTTGAVIVASASLRPVLICASIVAALAIVPAAVLQGRPGAFFVPLVWSYLLAVGAALLVALTVTPALSALLFARFDPEKNRDWPWAQRLGERYANTVDRFGRRLAPALITVAAIALVGLAILPFVRVTLLPELKDRNLLIKIEGQPGTSNVSMTERTAAIAESVRAVPGVASVGAHVGRAVTGDRVVNVNSSNVWVHLAAGADHDATLRAISDTVTTAKDLEIEVTSAASQEIRDAGALNSGNNEVTGQGLSVLTGLEHPVTVRVFGQDPTVLAEQAERVRQLLMQVEGAIEPRVLTSPTQPTIEIEVDLARAQRLGVSPGSVRRAEATLLQGIQVGSVFEDQRVFDVIVKGVPATRRSVDAIRGLLIDRPNGAPVTLGQVADVRTVETAAMISRDAVSRRIDVVAGLNGRPASEVVADVEQRLAQMNFPMEYHAQIMRQSTAGEIGQAGVIGFSIAAALGAFLIFQAGFGSWRLALLSAVVLPVSLTGGLVASLFLGAELSLGALLGLLATFGLAVRLGLAMIKELQQGGSARDRLVPALTTMLAVALLALPFVVMGGRPGLEILHPMAVVVLGGVITATTVILLVLPALYRHVSPGAVEPAPEEVPA